MPAFLIIFFAFVSITVNMVNVKGAKHPSQPSIRDECRATQYGCCENEITAKIDQQGSNCPYFEFTEMLHKVRETRTAAEVEIRRLRLAMKELEGRARKNAWRSKGRSSYSKVGSDHARKRVSIMKTQPAQASERL